MIQPSCWYYRRYLPPYVDGVLQARKAAMCRRLQRHIAVCTHCRREIAELAQTQRSLRARATLARADDIWSRPHRGEWRRRSLGQRVTAQLVEMERAARRRRIAARYWLVTASLAAALVAIAQPSPAREWIVRSFLRAPLAALAHRALPSRPAEGPATYVNPDPFRLDIALGTRSRTVLRARTSPSGPALGLTASALPRHSSGPPVPPLLAVSDPSPASRDRATVSLRPLASSPEVR